MFGRLFPPDGQLFIVRIPFCGANEQTESEKEMLKSLSARRL